MTKFTIVLNEKIFLAKAEVFDQSWCVPTIDTRKAFLWDDELKAFEFMVKIEKVLPNKFHFQILIVQNEDQFRARTAGGIYEDIFDDDWRYIRFLGAEM